MKMKQEHFNELKTAIESFIERQTMPLSEIVGRYETGDFPRADKVKDLQLRFNFDVFYAAKVPIEFMDSINYCNDDHIATALKRILPKIERRY